MTLFRFRNRMMTEKKDSQAKLAWWKKVLFGAILLLMLVGIVEIISFVGLRMSMSRFSMQRLYNNQNMLARSGSSTDHGGETIHPYLGWVHNPQANSGADIGDRHFPVNSFGFLDDEAGIPRRAPGRLVVGVLGGSVAWQMSAFGEERLLQTLQADSHFRNKEIRIVRLALSGYKQPQQLMALNYYLALGAEFDVVVNIDGYNEIALPACENYEAGVFVVYPRMWHVWMQNIVDSRTYNMSYQLLAARADRHGAAQSVIESPIRFSQTRSLIWKFRDRYLHNRITDFGTALMTKQRTEGRGFHSDGPLQNFDSEEELFTSLADLWKNCSLQLHYLCTANSTLYLHILQPNQYHQDSKPMGPHERETAFIESQEYGIAIRKAYPQLIRVGAGLSDKGVRFHDLTMLFANIEEPIYADPFCHYNQRGNDLLAEVVAQRIVDAWGSQVR